MKLFGISRFLTQKLSWSLVNKFPVSYVLGEVHVSYILEEVPVLYILEEVPVIYISEEVPVNCMCILEEVPISYMLLHSICDKLPISYALGEAPNN